MRPAGDWRDYYRQLERLGEDLTDPALLMPRDMREKHQAMIEREEALRKEKELKRLEVWNETFQKKLSEYRRKYGFRAAGLVLRPFESAEEVMREGNALHICIGSYAERYMRGGTVICCLRREEEPDEPFRAVEFDPRSGRVLQDRGMYNDTRGGIQPGTKKQLRLFWAAFDREKGRRSA